MNKVLLWSIGGMKLKVKKAKNLEKKLSYANFCTINRT